MIELNYIRIVIAISDADVKARIGKARTEYLQLKNISNSKQLSVNQHQSQNSQYKCQDSSTVWGGNLDNYESHHSEETDENNLYHKRKDLIHELKLNVKTLMEYASVCRSIPEDSTHVISFCGKFVMSFN
ncbi:unnamed protein product [Schistosoma mattheei]|uniref:Uncharacterized protein n=1 Tax=Schistosoma mattheei TaxID=31246 RepID=A0A3P8DJW0_9TREM|nr:unnamed protein product [Schistosoma mattheei]